MLVLTLSITPSKVVIFTTSVKRAANKISSRQAHSNPRFFQQNRLTPDVEALVAGAGRPSSYDYFATHIMRYVMLRGRDYDLDEGNTNSPIGKRLRRNFQNFSPLILLLVKWLECRSCRTGIVRLNEVRHSNSPNLIIDWGNFLVLPGKYPNTYFKNQPISAAHHNKLV